ncbi:MAG: DUF4855 domain-containing protein, partial [Thermicanus sp.]|nr:DUF4855 domain-containing protein [Thermicanus sp.]
MDRVKIGILFVIVILLLSYILLIPLSTPVVIPTSTGDPRENGYYRKLLEWSDESVIPPKDRQLFLPRVIDSPLLKMMRKKIDHGPGINLSLKKPYTVTIEWEDSYFHKLENDYPDSGMELTDGVYGTLDWKNGSNPWVGFLRQGGRWITIDLGEVRTIHSLSLDFLQRLEAGITVPEYVRYEVSLDGENWFEVGKVDTTVGSWEARPDSDPFLLKGLHVNARYVRAYFPTSVLHFIDEFAVYGEPKADPKGKQATAKIKQESSYRGYLRPYRTPERVHNLLLHYVRQEDFREVNFQPLITYINEKGEISDWMFDAILFVPLSLPTTQKAWGDWLDGIFYSSRQLEKLNEAAANGSAALEGKKFGAKDHKIKVILSIPYPRLTAEDWGGNEESPISFDPFEIGQKESYLNRLKAVKWFIEQALARWNNARFDHLELAGFYWDGETLNLAAQYEKNLIRDTADFLHARQEKFYWIPYYGAYGAEQWRELGFDMVMVQPNFSFTRVDVSRLEKTAEWAYRHGTGIEIEAHWFITALDKKVATYYKNRFYDYFTAGHLQKYEYSTLNGWYMNVSTLEDA